VPHFGESPEPPLPGVTGVNAQTGTTYLYTSVDRAAVVTHNSAAPVAATLPSVALLPVGFYFYVKNTGAGLLTLTPASGQIDGAASATFATGDSALLCSNGANWLSVRVPAFVNGVVTAALTGLASLNLPLTGGTVSGPILEGANQLGYRRLPAASVTSGTFTAQDAQKLIQATAGVTAPNGVMTPGDVVTVYNTTAAPITITAAVATLTLAGVGTTGNRTLAAKGICEILFLSATSAVISGFGVT
jgi:hypothetical protein